jgi:hypothetical protein
MSHFVWGGISKMDLQEMLRLADLFAALREHGIEVTD